MGWDVPVMAHIPLIHGADGAKLSKRHGALGIEAYREQGYLPQALRNYLCRLGWSHGDAEIFSTEQAIAWFDIVDVNKAPARLDMAKLADVNAHYIRQAGEAELIERLQDLLGQIEPNREREQRFAAVGWDRLAAALPSLRPRAKTLLDLLDGAAYLIAERPLPLDDKAKKLLDPQARALLPALEAELAAVADWQAATLETAVKAFAEQGGRKLGQIAQPLRAALTGRSVSPPVFDVMQVLGRAETLARIRDQVP
jgi:glutamyl-tRNA synthetase